MKVMKSRKHSPKTQSKKAATEPKYSAVLTDMFRSAWRASRYAFLAGAGIWLPRAEAATLINLDATSAANYPQGPINTWTNTGTVIGDFTNNTATLPVVTNINGIECIYFDGTGGGGGASMIGPNTPASVGGNKPRTIEAWIFDPARVYQGTKVLFG